MSRCERTGPSGGDCSLILLQTDFEIGVALIPCAPQVLGVLGAVTALPVRQLTIYILHRDELQLKVAC